VAGHEADASGSGQSPSQSDAQSCLDAAWRWKNPSCSRPGRDRRPVRQRRLVHDRARFGYRPRRPYWEGWLDRRMRVYIAPNVLIIDEMGYLPLDDLGATLFFH
jgi:IstB-like ATP binding protein